MEKKNKLTLVQTITLASLLFGLFFGAGNVIFPVKLGQMAASNFLPASLGFIITAVGLPILGIISSASSQRKGLLEYASPAGNLFGKIFTLALYLSIGPFFAIPRTATTAFEVGFGNYSTTLPPYALFLYSAIFFSLVWFFAKSPRKIYSTVGKFLTPLFLCLITVLLLFVIIKPMGNPFDYEALGNYQNQALVQGVLAGYETMDALASLAFAIIITQAVQQLGVENNRQIAKETAKAGLFTIIAFGLLYGCLVFLGASSWTVLQEDVNGGRILASVSAYYFGQAGQILLALIIAVACLKTAIGLIISISETFCTIFPSSSYRLWMYLFIGISFGISNFGLSTILQWTVPILMFLYPITIVYILLWTLHSFVAFDERVFKLTQYLTTLAAFFDLLKSLPETVRAWPWIAKLIAFAKTYLPLYDLGLGWILPAFCGLVLSALIYGLRNKKTQAGFDL